MNAFLAVDLTKGIKDLDLTKETLPNQRSLGLCWDMESDKSQTLRNLSLIMECSLSSTAFITHSV